MPNGLKELNFQLIKVEVDLKSGKIHPGRGVQPEKELRPLSAPTERDVPAGNRAQAEQPEDVLTQQTKSTAPFENFPILQKPRGRNLPSKITPSAASQDESTRCVRSFLVLDFTRVRVC